MSRTTDVSRAEVVAFRLRAHGLAQRAPEDGLIEAAGRCGIQDTPPGSALLALHARVRGVTDQRLAEALGESKSLLRTWSLRGAPFVVPTADAGVFTTGVLPPTELATRHLLLGLGEAVDRLGLTVAEVVDLTAAQLRPVLSGRRLPIGALGAELAGWIAPTLPGDARSVWDAEGPYAARQPLGEAVVHFCLRVLCLRGVVCFAPRDGNTAPFVLVDEWLEVPGVPLDPAVARAELVRRYLRCYGPSTRRDLAAWIGVSPRDAAAWWSLVEEELTPVQFGGRSWLLTEDLDALRSATMPTGVRLLPPHDPYLRQRGRETILDRRHHREVWRTVGDPGVLLADGEVVGMWRPQRTGQRLRLKVTPFRDLTDGVVEAVRAQAEQVAVLRGAASAQVDIATT